MFFAWVIQKGISASVETGFDELKSPFQMQRALGTLLSHALTHLLLQPMPLPLLPCTTPAATRSLPVAILNSLCHLQQ